MNVPTGSNGRWWFERRQQLLSITPRSEGSGNGNVDGAALAADVQERARERARTRARGRDARSSAFFGEAADGAGELSKFFFTHRTRRCCYFSCNVTGVAQLYYSYRWGGGGIRSTIIPDRACVLALPPPPLLLSSPPFPPLKSPLWPRRSCPRSTCIRLR